MSTELDLSNIQGDILGGLPKRTETCYFFSICNVEGFASNLNQLVPLIKTTEQVVEDRKKIAVHKATQCAGLVPISSINIAFSQSGLTKLNITDNLGDESFAKGQRADAQSLGDAAQVHTSEYVPDWEEPFLQDIHGVVIVACDCCQSTTKTLNQVKAIFGVGTPQASITEVTTVEGKDRDGENHGHEHFGFLDGISNPAIIGFDPEPELAPKAIKPGFLLLKQDGDATARPDWAADGSFLTFRYLYQLVPEFNQFLEDNPIVLPGLDRKHGSELLGARLFGRWKNGAPTELSPTFDDPEFGKGSKRINDFDFGDSLVKNDQSKCPFAAHIRKTYPRKDLEGPPLSADISVNRIMRRGIPFGCEVSETERCEKKTSHGRGLLFICYSSTIDNGFAFMQKAWVNSPAFPVNAVTSLGPIPALDGVVPGFDPIIGQQTGGGPRQMSGTNPNDPTTNITLPMSPFVVPRGGEYFFSPSITALKTKFAACGNASTSN
ncbi:dyp-type peroxidase [Pleurotus djamor]|nr:dyp-type peroxidase [Pleurotus djamor]